MRSLRLFLGKIVLCGVVSSALSACSGNLKEPESAWSTLAKSDVLALYEDLKSNHPGAVDTENPQFRVWLEEGKAKALAESKSISRFQGYQAVLRRYVAGFQDSHLNATFLITPKDIEWSGFLVKYNGDSYEVAYRSDSDDFQNLPQIGAILVGCEGKPADSIYEESVIPYRGVKNLDSYKYRLAPLIVVDDGNPFVSRPQECTFRTGLERKTIKLDWRADDYDRLMELVKKVTAGNPPSFEFVRLKDGGYWISLPRFWATGSGLKALQSVMSAAKENSASLKRAPYVVFDVRGNTGGSSEWGKQLAVSLWGEQFLERYKPDSSAIDHRASRVNIAHYEKMVDVLKERFGNGSESVNYFDDVLKGMKSAHSNGENYFRKLETERRASDESDQGKSENPVRARVFFLTDASCNSACLDFADIVLSMPGVKHVGLPTSADTAYMEVRSRILPSGAVRVIVPTKVYRRKVRKNNEPYVPSDLWRGDISDTAALRKWISGLATGSKD